MSIDAPTYGLGSRDAATARYAQSMVKSDSAKAVPPPAEPCSLLLRSASLDGERVVPAAPAIRLGATLND